MPSSGAASGTMTMASGVSNIKASSFVSSSITSRKQSDQKLGFGSKAVTLRQSPKAGGGSTSVS